MHHFGIFRLRRRFASRMRSGFDEQAHRAASQKLRIYDARCASYIRRDIEVVITRRSWKPFADRHVGSNPTPSANAKAPNGCLFALAGNLCEKPFCLAKVGSHLSLKPMGACSQEARRKIFAVRRIPHSLRQEKPQLNYQLRFFSYIRLSASFIATQWYYFVVILPSRLKVT